MDIPIHADVSCYDGLVGKSSYIIVDLVTEQVTHFVVNTEKHGGEYLVPLDMVTDTVRTFIGLNCRKEDVYKLPPFHETQFKGYDDYGSSPPIPSPGIAATHTLYHPYRTAEADTESSSAHPSMRSLAISKGAHVLATDGQVGKIDEVVIDPDSHRVTHMVLRRRDVLDKWIVTIPVSAIERAEMDTVYLKIDTDAVKALPHVALKRFPWE